MTTPTQMVLITSNPNKTAHAKKVISELFRGTFVECEQWAEDNNSLGFIWQAKLWDAFIK